jgi:hypothetical protein
MIQRGCRKANGEWDVPKLHGFVGGSRAWLYKIVQGKKKPSVEEYERLFTGLGQPSFQAAISTMAGKQPRRPREIETLHADLDIAIDNAIQTGTMEGVKYAIRALVTTTTSDRASMESARQVKNRSGPRP